MTTPIRPRVPQPREPDDKELRGRIVVVAAQNLVGEAVRMALHHRGFRAVSVRWPSEHRLLRESHRRVASAAPEAGILVCDLRDPARVREAKALIRSTPLRWLVLVDDPDSIQQGAMVSVGVRGVLAMSTGLDELSQTLSRVLSDEELMTPETRERLVRDWREQEATQRRINRQLASLTPREMQVLLCLYEGLPVKAIAGMLGVAEGTVRSQVKSVLRKLDVGSQLEAVAAVRQVHGGPGAPGGGGQ